MHAGLWAGKYVDQRTGDVHVVYRDAADGPVAGADLRTRASSSAAARPARHWSARATPSCGPRSRPTVGGAVADASAAPRSPVGVWLDGGRRRGREAVVRPATPSSTWDGDRPIVDDLATARAIRAELAQAREPTPGPRPSTQLRIDVEALGGSIGYASTSAPLVVPRHAGRWRG